VDLDIDTDNNNGFNEPDMKPIEDNYEDVQGASDHPGKIMGVNDNDDDSDRIPDFADGFNWDYNVLGSDSDKNDNINAAEKFIPIVLKIHEPIELTNAIVRIGGDYIDSDPMAVTRDNNGVYHLPQDDSNLRIWSKPGNVRHNPHKIENGGDIITQGTYPAETLGFSNGIRQVTFYLEAVRPSNKRGVTSMSLSSVSRSPFAGYHTCSRLNDVPANLRPLQVFFEAFIPSHL